MATKLQLVSELAHKTAMDVTRDPEIWMRFLDTASRMYKYSFDDQILIYAQRADATACATMNLWNTRMRRWVRAGTSSISLIHKNNGRPRGGRENAVAVGTARGASRRRHGRAGTPLRVGRVG